MVELHQARKIDRTHDVGIVQQERVMARILEKKPPGPFQASTRIEQQLLTRDFNVHSKVLMGLQIGDDHLGEMMDIDDHFPNAKIAQPR